MDEMYKIKNRIEKNQGPQQKRRVIANVIMTFLILTSLGLGFLIYARIDANGTFLNRIFNTNISFVQFNTSVSNFLDRMFNFNLFGGSKSQTVDSEVRYISLGNNRYQCEGDGVKMLMDGQIAYIDTSSNDYVVVSYHNGVRADYFDLFDLTIKNGDELDSGTIFASYQDSFKVIFTKNNTIIDYEEARKV